MKRLIVDNFGPIKHFELDIKNFMVFTGPQASGKSTIAKLIFFFENIGNLVIQEIFNNQYYEENILPTNENKGQGFSRDYFLDILKKNFKQIFGNVENITSDMRLIAFYQNDFRIEIFVKKNKNNKAEINIKIDEGIYAFLQEQYAKLDKNLINKERENLVIEIEELLKELDEILKKKEGVSDFAEKFVDKLEVYDEPERLIYNPIKDFFSEGRQVVYIPAGRSMMMVLSSQWEYLYSTMDDWQKSNIDYCTKNYIERILKIKNFFDEPLDNKVITAMITVQDIIEQAVKMIKRILQGEYIYNKREEWLQLSDSNAVKINFASSGQQEALWILNLIFMYLWIDQNTTFIIEEPESNLFPNAQKLITEFIALAQNNGSNRIVITTHSPYILGTINNLLYASKIQSEVDEDKLEKIVSKVKRIKFDDLAAFFIENGEPKNCTDKEFESIKNEVIDGASEDINQDFDNMLELL